MNTVVLSSLVVLCLVSYGQATGQTAQQACDQALPNQAFTIINKQRGVGKCSDLCAADGKTCSTKAGVGLGRAVAIYPEWDSTFYGSCNTLYSNVCCCQQGSA